MTQDSNPSPQMQWGRQPALPPQPAWWLGVLTVPSLLGHIVVMLGVCSALTVANLLAGPLIELAPAFASALAPGGTIMLAGLLDTQADGVVRAYEALGLKLQDRGSGEWPVLVLRSGQ